MFALCFVSGCVVPAVLCTLHTKYNLSQPVVLLDQRVGLIRRLSPSDCCARLFFFVCLPRPTVALPQVPRMLIEHKHHKKTWKRKEIGIRLPDAPVLLDLLQQLDGWAVAAALLSDLTFSPPCSRAHLCLLLFSARTLLQQLSALVCNSAHFPCLSFFWLG